MTEDTRSAESPFGDTEPGAAACDAAVAFEQLAAAEERLRVANRSLELADALFEIGRHMSLATRPTEVAGLVLGLACDAVGASYGYIERRELGGWVTSHVHGASLARVGAFRSDEERPLLAEMRRTGRPVVSAVGTITPDHARVARDPGECLPRMTFPLTLRGRIVGALTLCFDNAESPFGEEAEIAFGSRLATMISTTEENALTLSRHRKIAEAFQRALLDIPRALPGIDFGHLYEPATDSDVAGGDFYDIFSLGDSHVAVAIGDVAGRGLAAITKTALVRDTVRGAAIDDLSPADVLTKVNRVLLAFSEPEMFATVFYAVIDSRSGRIEYASAGGPPAILVDAGGDPRALEDSGPLLGVLDTVRLDVHEATLEPGGQLILYTNGLSSACCERVPTGLDGILDIVRQTSGLDARSRAQAMLERAFEIAGGSFRDDVAILVMGLKGAGDRQGPEATG